MTNQNDKTKFALLKKYIIPKKNTNVVGFFFSVHIEATISINKSVSVNSNIVNRGSTISEMLHMLDHLRT